MRQLDLIVGPMYSGKSFEIIRYEREAQVRQLKVLVVRPIVDGGQTEPYIYSRFWDMKIPAELVSSSQEIVSKMKPETDLVMIDEGQFFDPGIVEVVYSIRQTARVVIAGLNLDFRGLPFGPIPDLLAMASSVKLLSAFCSVCGKDAEFSQRLTDGQPSSAFAENVLIEGRRSSEDYQPRCRIHFQPPPDLERWFQIDLFP